MLSDWELWTCANKVIETHGDGAESYVAERIASLQSLGEEEGVATWTAIGHRLQQLRSDGHGEVRH